MNRNTFLLVFSALIIGIGFNSFYIVNEKQNAIVLQFGEAVRADIPVGISFQTPNYSRSKKI
jgi:membrane protease subunit HflC